MSPLLFYLIGIAVSFVGILTFGILLIVTIIMKNPKIVPVTGLVCCAVLVGIIQLLPHITGEFY